MPHRRRGPLRTARIRLRVLLRRLDRETPDWMRWLLPWGWSLALHAVLIAAFGLLVYVNAEAPAVRATGFESTIAPADQLTEDLTSLAPADRAGDPFTKLQIEEPPSFSTDTKGATDSITPASALPIGPGNGLDVPAPSGLDSVAGADGPGLRVPEPSVPFSGRQGPAKARLVRREGGSVESEKAVEAGLDWLARHQLKDGHWSMDPRGACVGAGCPANGHVDSDVAATGLALLPMLGAGHSHLAKGRYQATVRRGLDWLLEVQQSTGEVFTGSNGQTRMYSHAIATMTLCEAYGITHDKALKEPAERAVRFLAAAQDPHGGGWRYQPGEAGDTSVLGWQMLAIRSARLAGLDVPKEVFRNAEKYLDSAATDSGKTLYTYQPGGPSNPVMTAEALLVRQYLGWPRETPALSKGVKHVSEHLLKDRERNIYYWYYATQLLHNMQNVAWNEWNPRVRGYLIKTQVNGTGCSRGSWDPGRPTPDRWGTQAGRHYLTALSVLTLEVYYRYLPLYKAGDSAVTGMAPTSDKE